MLTSEQKEAIDKAIKFSKERGDDIAVQFYHAVMITELPEQEILDYLYDKSKSEGELTF